MWHNLDQSVLPVWSCSDENLNMNSCVVAKKVVQKRIHMWTGVKVDRCGGFMSLALADWGHVGCESGAHRAHLL
jgi:hypothetical protein